MPDLSVVVCLGLNHRSAINGLEGFKACISRCPFVDAMLEVTGTFDLIIQGRCSSVTEFTDNLEAIGPQIREFVTRLETNFVGKRIDERLAPDEQTVLWLPCKDGHRRVETRFIDKVVAESDYMRVHVGDWDCLILSTMWRLRKKLGSAMFIQLHRSTLVRIEFVDRLVHKTGGWKARLRDGSIVNVSKPHVKEVLQLVSGERPLREIDRPKQAVPATPKHLAYALD